MRRIAGAGAFLGVEATEPVAADAGFNDFARDVGDRLRRVLVARCGVDDGCDLAAEALSYAWEHWDYTQLIMDALAA